jgi:hypothetical protein
MSVMTASPLLPANSQVAVTGRGSGMLQYARPSERR